MIQFILLVFNCFRRYFFGRTGVYQHCFTKSKAHLSRKTSTDSNRTANNTRQPTDDAATEQQTALNNEKAADTRHSGRKLVPLSNGRVTLSGVAHQSAHDNSVLSNKGFNKPINDFEFNTETKEEGNSEKIVPVDYCGNWTI